MKASALGLSPQEALARLSVHGPNRLPEPKKRSLALAFLSQFKSPVIAILLVALVLETAAWIEQGRPGVPGEAAVIAAVLLLNAGLGLYQEFRAEAALQALKGLGAPSTVVVRGGEALEVPAEQVVPGDTVRVLPGSRVPADLVLTEAQDVAVDESALTGESFPVEKDVGDELLAGTFVVAGTGLAEVTRTGAASNLGVLALRLETLEDEKTPLERRVDAWGLRVAWWVTGIAALFFLAGLWVEGVRALPQVLLFSVSIAVAAVPEGFPAVLTFALARGIREMARHNALVRRRMAVEALGSVTVIASDKTGTLTQNKMQVERAVTEDEASLVRAIALTLAPDLATTGGDPMDLALQAFVASRGVDPSQVRSGLPLTAFEPFTSRARSMSATYGDVTYVKGAPEVVVPSGPENDAWREHVSRAAREGYRVLALATSRDGSSRVAGLVLIGDPPRPEAAEAVQAAHDAGIRVLMVTGDHPETARTVAERLGILTAEVWTGPDLAAASRVPPDVNVFARILPEEKLRLVELLKAEGHTVAMTGDGVNDAPALKRADVGVAMGLNGSDVAREVSDLVLLDDNFATIVAAIRTGRGVYANIERFVRFLFATNLAEVGIVMVGVLAATVFGLRQPGGALFLPLTAAQLLWVNMVTDSLPALALGTDRTRSGRLGGPRATDAPLLDPWSTRFVLVVALAQVVAATVLVAVLLKRGESTDAVRTALFEFVALAQFAVAYPSRGRQHVRRNPWLAVAVAAGVFLQGTTLALAPLRQALGLALPSAQAWAVTGLAVAAVWMVAEAVRRYSRASSLAGRTAR